MDGSVAGIGRLGIGDTWVGIATAGDSFELVFGGPDGRLYRSPAQRERKTDELLAVAIAYFEETLEPPPPELEATQGDLGELVRWLTECETDAERRRALRDALDAIDDGLAGDIVVARLAEARGPKGRTPNEQADVVDLLVSRYRALSTPRE